MIVRLDRGEMKEKKARAIASLFKKAKELSILCGIVISIIIFNPGERIPIMWPNENESKMILTRYLALPQSDRLKKFVEHETYLVDKITYRREKIKEKWRKILQNNDAREMKIMFKQLLEGKVNLSELQLDAQKIKGLLNLSALTRININERKKQITQQSQTFQLSRLFFNFDLTMMKNSVDQNRYFYVGSASTSLVGANRGKHKLIEDHDDESH